MPSSEACRRRGAKRIHVTRIASGEENHVHDTLGSGANQGRTPDVKKGSLGRLASSGFVRCELLAQRQTMPMVRWTRSRIMEGLSTQARRFGAALHQGDPPGANHTCRREPCP